MKNYKTIIVIFATISVVFANEFTRKHDKCIAESGANPDFIPLANEGNFVNDEKFKCYLKCICVEIGAMDEDGNISYTEEVVKIMPPETRQSLHKAADYCVTTLTSSDPCEKAYEFSICVQKTDPKYYRLF